MATMAERLKGLRKERGWTQKELQAMSGVPYTTISRIERGNPRQINTNTLVALADALEVTTDYLLGRSNKRID